MILSPSQNFYANFLIRDRDEKETTHYENKKTGTPHRSISGCEAEQFYQRIAVLALSIIRNKNC